MKLKFIAFFLIGIATAWPQDSLRSSVYRKKGFPSSSIRIVQPSDVTYQLWEGFSLVRNANSGDAGALHELGLRYLTGKGFPADTVRAFQLIKQAADHHYLLAYFNLGVFCHNGWGTEWNPFEAYKYFRYTADNDLKEGEYAFGLYFTDNLAVQQDWKEAYQWIKRSAEQGYAPAKEILPELERLAATESSDSSSVVSNDSSSVLQKAFQPVLLNFDNEKDEIVEETFSAIEILQALGSKWQKRIKELPGANDSILFSLLLHHVQWGVPEEYTVLGRFYEKGIGVKQDSIHALTAYIHAVRLESRRAPGLLLRLLDNRHLLDVIQKKAQQGNVEGMYTIASLALTEIFSSQKKEDIISFLQKSAQERNIDAMVELGNAYFSGQLVSQQKEKAMQLWTNANRLGNNEALIRIASAKIIGGYGGISIDSAFQILQTGNAEESPLAQVNLAYCYEHGIIVAKRIPEAVRLYRSASQRGSRAAFVSLQRLYDSIRPRDREFQIIDRQD